MKRKGVETSNPWNLMLCALILKTNAYTKNNIGTYHI